MYPKNRPILVSNEDVDEYEDDNDAESEDSSEDREYSEFEDNGENISTRDRSATAFSRSRESSQVESGEKASSGFSQRARSVTLSSKRKTDDGEKYDNVSTLKTKLSDTRTAQRTSPSRSNYSSWALKREFDAC